MLDRPDLRITSADDPRIEVFRNVRERDLVGREGRFIAEGEVVLRVLLGQTRHRPLALLLDERRLSALAPLLDTLSPDVPVYTSGRELLSEIVGFNLHRGILALAEKAPERSAADLLAGCGARALVVCALGIANHDNVGGIFRNAAAFGADAVLLDETSCDPFYRKAIRVSVGGALVVPWARVERKALLTVLDTAGFTPLALTPVGTTTLRDLKRPQRAAVLLGTEGEGLPEAIMARALTVGIPMAQGFDSLNVATTSGIVLHALADA